MQNKQIQYKEIYSIYLIFLLIYLIYKLNDLRFQLTFSLHKTVSLKVFLRFSDSTRNLFTNKFNSKITFFIFFGGM